MTICWAVAALWLWQLPAPLADHQYRLQQAIDQHAHNTTDISRHYLERALQGHYENRFAVTRTTGWERIGNDNRILCRTGHAISTTSGVDCLAGMLHGFRENPEHHELISTFSPVARLWGYAGNTLPNFAIGQK
ncbi:DUF2877 domain-containing protein [Shigella sonnei]